VLTAAHCCAREQTKQIMFLNDDGDVSKSAPPEILDARIDKGYDGTTHDFCLLDFTAPADALRTLSVIPPLTPAEDHLAPGDTLDFVGYGTTMDGTPNAVRRHITLPLASVDDLTVRYDQSGGGPCHGDSGGPGLVTVNGVEKIAAVISRGPDG